MRRDFRVIASDLDRREKELAALRAVDDAIKESVEIRGNIASIDGLILEKAMMIIRAHTGFFLRFNTWDSKFDVKAQQGHSPSKPLPPQLENNGIVGLAGESDEPVLVFDVEEPPWKGRCLPIAPGTRSVLAAAMRDAAGLAGVINLEDPKPNFFSEDDKKLLEMLAAQALIAIHSADFLQRYEQTIRSLRSLGVIAARVQTATLDTETLMRVFLTGVTANEGLGLSRAMLFLVNEENKTLQGAMAIGNQDAATAHATWTVLDGERDQLRSERRDALDTLLERAETFSLSVREGKQDEWPLSQAVRAETFDLTNATGAVVECLRLRRCIVVRHDQNDPFRHVLSRVSGHGDVGSAFACIPVAVHERLLLGVLVVDNRFLPSEQGTDFDLSALETYANVLAISLETKRLQKHALYETFLQQLGHDLVYQINRIAVTIQRFRTTVYDAPYLSEMFWNSPLGDRFRDILDEKHSLVRFLEDLRHFGEPITLDCKRVPISRFMERQGDIITSMYNLQGGRRNPRHEISISSEMPLDLVIEIDENIMARATHAILDNAAKAFREANTLDPCIKFVAWREHHLAGYITIVISDNGPGIPPDSLHNVFKPFVTTRGATGGQGLGLANAKRYIEAHGGTIQAARPSGAGAQFIITLPAH